MSEAKSNWISEAQSDWITWISNNLMIKVSNTCQEEKNFVKLLEAPSSRRLN